jgi:hypothetical protein
MIGLEFEPLVAGDAKLKGEMILQDSFGIPTDYSKWWDLVALVFLLISYRFLFFLALKHKESASSLLQTTNTYLDKLLTRTPLSFVSSGGSFLSNILVLAFPLANHLVCDYTSFTSLQMSMLI